MAVLDWGVLFGPGRWQRKYKLVLVLLFVIFSVQLFLGYHSSKLDVATERQDGQGPSPFAQHNSQAGSLPVDDEDVPSNSNSYNAKSNNAQTNNHLHAPKEDFIRSIATNGGDSAPKKSHLVDLAFTPGCEVQSKDAWSAVNRARTEECKRQILDTVCAIESGTFYAEHLTSQCPTGNFTRGKSLGCFQDEQVNRLLGGYYVNHKGINSPKKCMDVCLQSGFVYAGVQYGSECFCGNTAPPSTAVLAESSCNMKCPGGGREDVCGGYFTMNVFETGIAKFEAQTAELVPKQGEDRVKIVFLLTLNGRALRQVKRLIRTLFHSSHYFYIHVDSRQDYLYRELKALELEYPNIKLTTNRHATIWGGASLLQMLLSCMKELLAIADWHWDIVINLSESDFPVKRLDQLVDFLTANKGRNFVKSHGRETQRFVLKQGLDKTFVECDMHMWRVGDRQLPLGIQVDGGSDWVALDRRFVEFVIGGIKDKDPLVTGLLTIFRHTLLPAESFFHTTLRNSRFCGTYVDNNLHFTNWKRKLGCKCQYRHVVDWCGCSPNDFKPDDWARLEGTGEKQLFFARKFEPIINQAVLQKLEEWMFGRSAMDYENLKSYWQSVYHHLDQSPRADDSVLTLCSSLIRMSMESHFEGKFRSAEEKESLLANLKILEVTYLMEDDRFKGFLVRYQMEDNHSNRIELEFLAKGTQMVQTNKKAKFAERISVLEVSTDFDQKEQRARNYAKIMGPFAEPVVLFQLRRVKEANSNAHGNVTALWIDPVGNIGDISEIIIDDQPNLIYFAKANLVHPLQPGVWTVKLLQRGTALAVIKFLVVPLQFLNQKAITKSKARIVNQGTENELSYGNSLEWDRHLLPRSERIALMGNMQGNGERYGVELEHWIDRLVKSFYLIHDYCVVVVSPENPIVDRNGEEGNAAEKGSSSRDWTAELQRDGRFLSCALKSWSSLAPDPKSDIRARWSEDVRVDF